MTLSCRHFLQGAYVLPAAARNSLFLNELTSLV